MLNSGAPHYEVIGASFDLGSSERGSASVPGVLRDRGLAKLLGWLSRRGVRVEDGGDVVGSTDGDEGSRPKNLAQMLSFSADLMTRLDTSYDSCHVPVVIGGDHSVSIPSVSAAAGALRRSLGADAELGLVWLDAHPDLETPQTSRSGDLHAMVVSHLLGHGITELSHLGGFAPKLSPGNVVYIGLRDVTSAERAAIREHAISAYSASDVERLGISEICHRAFAHMSARTQGFVLSFDIDVCDPSVAPGVEYREPGGLTYREARVVMELASQAANLVSLELVELIPSRDSDSRTAELGIELLRSALGGPVL